MLIRLTKEQCGIKSLENDKGSGVEKAYPFIVNDLPHLDVVNAIDPSLLEFKSEKKATDKLSTAVIFMKFVSFLISLVFLVF